MPFTRGIQRPICIVLTSCIDPYVKGKSQVQRSDPAIRLRDYQDALTRWLLLPDQRIRKILYIDNSGYPLDELEATARQTNPYQRICEFVSMRTNEIIEGLSYGHAEFKLFDAGLQNSNLLEPGDLLLKSTGRYLFPRVSLLLDRLPSSVSFAADSVNFYSVGIHQRKLRYYRSSRTSVALFLSSQEFYQRHIKGLAADMTPFDWNRSAFVENLLFHRLYPLHDNREVVLRFPVDCSPQGIGGNNRKYRTVRHTLLRAARNMGRRVVPHFWF